MKAIHFICRRDDANRFVGLAIIDPAKQIYDSCCWALSDEQAHSLVGGWCYLHPIGKNYDSEFGGVVLSVRHAKREGKAVEQGYAFRIESKLEGKKQKWRGLDHTNAWMSGVIEATYVHELSSA